MVLAFEKYKTIEKLPTIQEKHRFWLRDYEGCNFSIAEEGSHKLKWMQEPKQYKDRNFNSSINCVAPRKDRLIIELEPNGEDLERQYEEVENKLREIGAGFIKSEHKGKSPYIWVEFTRELTESEKKRFLGWIAPENSIVDLNFAFHKKVFPVLYATHWKHSFHRELPIDYVEGKKIDFDTLNIPKKEPKAKVINKRGFKYEVLEQEPLKLKQFDYFKKLKPAKMGLVESLVPEKSLILTHSPPKSFKSLFELAKCVCISSGRKFLNQFKTKKSACLYIDLENSEFIIKDRWAKLRNFYGIRKIKTNLYYLGRDSRIDILNPYFISQIQEIVEKKKIKYIVVDTLPKASDYDTNSEREVNKIYTQFFKPLIEDYNISINFLLHTNKSGSSWIGSQAYHGIVDCAYEFQKLKNQKNKVKIISNNRGENIEFGVEFIFTDEEIQAYTFDVERDLQIIPKAKFLELLNAVKGLFTDETIRLKRKDISDRLQSNGIIIAPEKEGGHYSRATLTRVLRFLVDNKTLNNEGGVYWLIN